jgi:hypothetical protein
LPRNGVAGPPHFWPRGGQATPGLWGVVWPPRKAKKKKNGKMGFGLWGWPDHPLGPGGGFGTPPTGRRGWPKPPPGPWRWSGHPQNPKPIFSFFFFFGPFGVAGPPPKAWGGFSHPYTAKNGSATPFLGKGWLQPPRDSPPPPPFF